MDNNQENQQNSFDSSGQFGMTEEEVKNFNSWAKIKHYIALVEPSISRVLSAIIYWSIKIGKNIVKSVIRMILGKEV